jgi:hypothetical protein
MEHGAWCAPKMPTREKTHWDHGLWTPDHTPSHESDEEDQRQHECLIPSGRTKRTRARRRGQSEVGTERTYCDDSRVVPRLGDTSPLQTHSQAGDESQGEHRRDPVEADEFLPHQTVVRLAVERSEHGDRRECEKQQDKRDRPDPTPSAPGDHPVLVLLGGDARDLRKVDVETPPPSRVPRVGESPSDQWSHHRSEDVALGESACRALHKSNQIRVKTTHHSEEAKETRSLVEWDDLAADEECGAITVRPDGASQRGIATGHRNGASQRDIATVHRNGTSHCGRPPLRHCHSLPHPRSAKTRDGAASDQHVHRFGRALRAP